MPFYLSQTKISFSFSLHNLLRYSHIIFFMYLYIQLMLVFAVAPSVILLYLNRDKINFKCLFISLLILFIIGVIWDQISVRTGIWHFSQNEIIGNFLGMPIEEYLFIIFIPLLAINIYILVEKSIKGS